MKKIFFGLIFLFLFSQTMLADVLGLPVWNENSAINLEKLMVKDSSENPDLLLKEGAISDKTKMNWEKLTKNEIGVRMLNFPNGTFASLNGWLDLGDISLNCFLKANQIFDQVLDYSEFIKSVDFETAKIKYSEIQKKISNEGQTYCAEKLKQVYILASVIISDTRLYTDKALYLENGSRLYMNNSLVLLTTFLINQGRLLPFSKGNVQHELGGPNLMGGYVCKESAILINYETDPLNVAGYVRHELSHLFRDKGYRDTSLSQELMSTQEGVERMIVIDEFFALLNGADDQIKTMIGLERLNSFDAHDAQKALSLFNTSSTGKLLELYRLILSEFPEFDRNMTNMIASYIRGSLISVFSDRERNSQIHLGRKLSLIRELIAFSSFHYLAHDELDAHRLLATIQELQPWAGDYIDPFSAWLNYQNNSQFSMHSDKTKTVSVQNVVSWIEKNKHVLLSKSIRCDPYWNKKKEVKTYLGNRFKVEKPEITLEGARRGAKPTITNLQPGGDGVIPGGDGVIPGVDFEEFKPAVDIKL